MKNRYTLITSGFGRTVPATVNVETNWYKERALYISLFEKNKYTEEMIKLNEQIQNNKTKLVQTNHAQLSESDKWTHIHALVPFSIQIKEYIENLEEELKNETDFTPQYINDYLMIFKILKFNNANVDTIQIVFIRDTIFPSDVNRYDRFNKIDLLYFLTKYHYFFQTNATELYELISDTFSEDRIKQLKSYSVNDTQEKFISIDPNQHRLYDVVSPEFRNRKLIKLFPLLATAHRNWYKQFEKDLITIEEGGSISDFDRTEKIIVTDPFLISFDMIAAGIIRDLRVEGDYLTMTPYGFGLIESEPFSTELDYYSEGIGFYEFMIPINQIFTHVYPSKYERYQDFSDAYNVYIRVNGVKMQFILSWVQLTNFIESQYTKDKFRLVGKRESIDESAYSFVNILNTERIDSYTIDSVFTYLQKSKNVADIQKYSEIYKQNGFIPVHW